MGDHEHRSRHRKQSATTPVAPAAPGKQTLPSADATTTQSSYKGSLFDGTRTPWAGNDTAEGRDGEQSIEAIVENVVQSFGWLNDAAQAELETLRRDISKRDEPNWIGHLAEALLTVALSGGAAGIGAFLAHKLLPAAGEGIKALLETAFEEGIKEGVVAGSEALAGGHDGNVADTFIESHKRAVRRAYRRNQTAFRQNAAKRIKTLDQAKAIEEACSEDNLDKAARKQYEASRDAWVTYLGQAQLGVVGEYGPVGKHRGPLDDEPLATNMANERQREKQRQTWKQSQHGEDDKDAVIPDATPGYDAQGVLTVYARLPEIADRQMKGTPEVKFAVLGVNDAIRKQYENVPLADMQIPRQINAEVRGAPDFTINLDERGHYLQIPEQRRLWLRLRATAIHASGSDPYTQDKEGQVAKENASGSNVEQQHEGLQLLLRELIPTYIKKSLLL